MKRRGLSHIENLAQELVEGTFGRLFGGHLEPLDIANQLAKAIEDNKRSGQLAAQYQIAMSPEDFNILTKKNPNLAEDIIDSAYQISMQVGISGSTTPELRLVKDPDLSRRKMRISILAPEDPDSDQITRTYHHHKARADDLHDLFERDAFLIVQGRKHIPLDQPTLTLGRRIENDIVLDLPSVSRHHAQIRWRYGHFVIYDISAHSRTLVNGHAARECVLRPGDVIALGEALIVYGEGFPNRSSSSSEKSEDNPTLAR